MLHKKVLLLFLFLHFALSIVHCQMINVPYQFGFEKGDSEINNWKLNLGDRGEYCTDK